MHRPLLLTLALAACSSSPARDDVVGPFTGTVMRYVVDDIRLPTRSAEAQAMGDDLDGDEVEDNVFGMAVSTQAQFGNLTSGAPDMVAAGVISSWVEIVADDLENDPTAGVTYVGAAGATSTVVGGVLSEGRFVSNRTRTTHVPGAAVLHLPVFVDADPSVIELVGMQLELIPDGRGGFDGRIQGGFRAPEALAVAAEAIEQMLAEQPQAHRTLWWIADANHDGTVTRAEIVRPDGLIAAMLAPDLSLAGAGVGDDAFISVGFEVHLSPCAAGSCQTVTVTDPCLDRVHDGDETGVDCGGSCKPCPGAAGCTVDADCQSETCEASSVCAAPSCSNGRRDGFEAHIDCGGGCAGCAATLSCTYDQDCASGRCIEGVCGSSGSFATSSGS